MSEEKFIEIKDYEGVVTKHKVGDNNCDVGWCDNGVHYPHLCKRCQKGLVHAQFGDEGDEWLNIITKCDNCGESE